MSLQPNIASTAFMIADPARAAMLVSLLDGRARPAGELAYVAGVTAQTASAHLGKLLAGGLLTVETQGRHRYYRLAGAHVAAALEQLAGIAGTEIVVRRKALSREAQSLQFARCCYDHLAGRLGVAVTSGLQERGLLVLADERRFEVTARGREWFERMGLDVAKLKPNRRGPAHRCLDWTERHYHLAGPLGVEFLRLLCANGWLRRAQSSRAIQVTPRGCLGLKERLGIDPQNLEPETQKDRSQAASERR